MKRYRIAIVEPATVVGEGITAILTRCGEAEVVCCCTTLAELSSHRAIRNDIDLIFLSHTLISDVASLSEWDTIPIIVVQSGLMSSEALRRFAAVVSIYSSSEEIVRAMHEAADTPIEPSYAESHELSERERDVLILVARGFTNKEIASELNISPHTVISHRKNIVHKTGIRSVAGLTVYAVLNKLINSEQI